MKFNEAERDLHGVQKVELIKLQNELFNDLKQS